MTSRVPLLITILGATGTGKSKLGIELAQKYVGEVISADSMQVYKGLDVITAKVTKEEQSMATHHMIDIIDPLSTFTVVDFRNRALPIIDELMKDKKMPVIVGGTNYYIESLLWQVLVEDPKDNNTNEEMDRKNSLVFDRDDGYVEIRDFTNDNKSSASLIKIINSSERSIDNNINNENNSNVNSYSNEQEEDEDEEEEEEEEPPLKKIKFDDPITNEELHDKLKEIDPESASRLHPNNRRKIIRSLQVFQQLGTKHSEILRDQRLAGGSGLGGPLRYENSVILWIRCDQDVLDKRLDSRVDSMLDSGLVQELLDFHQVYNQERIKSNESPDYTKGIFQTIGFKEFHDYLILNEEDRNTEKGKKLLEIGIDNLKLRTRRYARKQHRWVMNRFIKRSDRQVPPVYSLDSTDISKWEENVLQPAITIIDAKLSEQIPNCKCLNDDTVEKNTRSQNDIESSHFCETCERVFIGEFQWRAHLNGRKHERMVKRRKMDKSL